MGLAVEAPVGLFQPPFDSPFLSKGNRVWWFRLLGIHSFSILFNHRSFEKPAASPGVLMVLWDLERMGTCPLEDYICDQRPEANTSTRPAPQASADSAVAAESIAWGFPAHPSAKQAPVLLEVGNQKQSHLELLKLELDLLTLTATYKFQKPFTNFSNWMSF